MPYHLRPAVSGFNKRAPTAGLVDELPSDYDSDELAAYHPPMATRGSVTRALATGYKTNTGLYDPKAAEFNQYLLEQQELMAAGTSSGAHDNAGAAGAATMSDDEDNYFGVGTSTSGLTRSRSCMLGPNAGGGNAQAKQAKYSSESSSKGSKQATDGRKLATWDGSGSGGRNTIA